MLFPRKVIVALDMSNKDMLERLISRVSPADCRLKIGKTTFVTFGPRIIEQLHHKGFEVFLDLKFHDIPQQVHGAISACSNMGVWMVNVHAMGGLQMLKAARDAIDSNGSSKPPLLIGVTLLTSLDQNDIRAIGIETDLKTQVLRLASLCKEAGLDGVVCSAHEASTIKKELGEGFLCITPGVRLSTDDNQDQKRVMTPKQAITAGSDYIVMGRSILNAKSPQVLLQQINEDINT